MSQMHLDRRLTDVQLSGYFAVPEAIGHEFQDLALSSGQQIASLSGAKRLNPSAMQFVHAQAHPVPGDTMGAEYLGQSWVCPHGEHERVSDARPLDEFKRMLQCGFLIRRPKGTSGVNQCDRDPCLHGFCGCQRTLSKLACATDFTVKRHCES